MNLDIQYSVENYEARRKRVLDAVTEIVHGSRDGSFRVEQRHRGMVEVHFIFPAGKDNENAKKLYDACEGKGE